MREAGETGGEDARWPGSLVADLSGSGRDARSTLRRDDLEVEREEGKRVEDAKKLASLEERLRLLDEQIREKKAQLERSPKEAE